MTEAQTIASLQANIEELTADLGRLRAENERLRKDCNGLQGLVDGMFEAIRSTKDILNLPKNINAALAREVLKAQEPRA